MSFLGSLFNDPKIPIRRSAQAGRDRRSRHHQSGHAARESNAARAVAHQKVPVLDAHGTPEIDLATWSFEVDGLVEHPQKWSLDEFMQLPAVRVYADFHCVTRWSRLDNLWGGVPTREFAKIVGIKPEAKFVLALAYDYGWTTNVPIEYFLNEDSLFAWSHDGAPIPPEHGGPVRLIIPQLYAWKSAKWVKGVRFLEQDQAGYWEEGGYHMRGVPWGPEMASDSAGPKLFLLVLRATSLTERRSKMRSNLGRLSLLFVLLVIAPQISSAVTSPSGQNTNSSTTMSSEPQPAPGSVCRIRCRNGYRRCLVAAGVNAGRRRSCAVRYRNCLKRCTR